MKIKNLAISVIALIILVVCAWLGASIYMGRTTSQKITALVSNPIGANSSVRLVEHQHEQGLFSSKGQFEIRFNNIPLDEVTGTQQFAIQVVYQVSNLLLPDSAMHVDWNVKPAGETGKELDRMFGKEITLSGKGKLGYGGKALTSLKLPELVLNEGSDKLVMSPSTGFASWKDKQMNFDWKTDRISFVTEGKSMEIEGISVTSDVQNRSRGTGTTQFSIAKLSTNDATLTGYSFKSLGVERGDRLDLSFNQKIDAASAANEKISNIVLDFSINDLDTESIEILGDIVSNATDKFENWTDDDKTKAIASVRKIMDKGFKVSVPKLYAEYGKGSITGSTIFEVLKAEPNATSFDITKSVRASGELLGNGKLLDQSQKAMVIMFGIAKETKEGLKASFDFNGKTLTVNGKSEDLSAVISSINDGINSVFYK